MNLLPINARPQSYLIGVGSNSSLGYKIDPPELRSTFEYDNMCPTFSRQKALEEFKLKYPDKFKENSTDAKTQLIFEKWQKAYKFWNGDYSHVEQMKVQAECPQEIQAIRAHLWEIIQDEESKTIEVYEKHCVVQAVTRLRDCINSSVCKKSIMMAVIITCVVILILKTKEL